ADDDHLRLLSIFHYILGAMNAFAGCLPLIHVTLGMVFLVGTFDDDPNAPSREIGLLFVVIGGGISLFCWTAASAKIFAGRSLARRANYRFCYIVAILECLQMPTGTALGVCTIVVLSRPSVKALFEGRPHRKRRIDDFEDTVEAPMPPRSDDGAIHA
ncbi:MAG: hypothetical protein HY289_12485, partial [Planctomycetes bacterium]|nr:hypothetical protein [Planctomycetota bacterium]